MKSGKIKCLTNHMCTHKLKTTYLVGVICLVKMSNFTAYFSFQKLLYYFTFSQSSQCLIVMKNICNWSVFTFKMHSISLPVQSTNHYGEEGFFVLYVETNCSSFASFLQQVSHLFFGKYRILSNWTELSYCLWGTMLKL